MESQYFLPYVSLLLILCCGLQGIRLYFLLALFTLKFEELAHIFKSLSWMINHFVEELLMVAMKQAVCQANCLVRVDPDQCDGTRNDFTLEQIELVPLLSVLITVL